MKLLALLMLANSLLASDTYAGQPGRWVAADLYGYVAADHRTSTGGDTRRAEHRYGIAAPQQADRIASWNSLPLGALVVVPRGNGYLDGDSEHDTPEKRVLPVDDDVPMVTEKARDVQRLVLGVRCLSQEAADRLRGKRVRVFVVDPPARP